MVGDSFICHHNILAHTHVFSSLAHGAESMVIFDNVALTWDKQHQQQHLCQAFLFCHQQHHHSSFPFYLFAFFKKFISSFICNTGTNTKHLLHKNTLHFIFILRHINKKNFFIPKRVVLIWGKGSFLALNVESGLLAPVCWRRNNYHCSTTDAYLWYLL